MAGIPCNPQEIRGNRYSGCVNTIEMELRFLGIPQVWNLLPSAGVIWKMCNAVFRHTSRSPALIRLLGTCWFTVQAKLQSEKNLT